MLNNPIPGEPIRADFLREIVEALRASRVQPGPGILVDRGPAGTVVSALERDDALAVEKRGPLLCRVTAAGLDGYSVQVFGNGRAETYTATAVLYAVEIGDMDPLPVGTWLLGFPGAAMTYEGND